MIPTMQDIMDSKVIAIIRGIPSTSILQTAEALLKGGINLIEITFDQSSSENISDTARSLNLVSQKWGTQISLGAGTVMTTEQVNIAKKNGASYIISPDVNEAVIYRTRELNMVSMPGAITPSEVIAAYSYGAHIVKLFPAGLLGPDYVKALRSPLSYIPLSAVGGINESNVSYFFEAGVCCVGIGGNLVSKKAIQEKNFNQISQKANAFLKAINI